MVAKIMQEHNDIQDQYKKKVMIMRKRRKQNYNYSRRIEHYNNKNHAIN